MPQDRGLLVGRRHYCTRTEEECEGRWAAREDEVARSAISSVRMDRSRIRVEFPL